MTGAAEDMADSVVLAATAAAVAAPPSFPPSAIRRATLLLGDLPQFPSVSSLSASASVSSPAAAGPQQSQARNPHPDPALQLKSPPGVTGAGAGGGSSAAAGPQSGSLGGADFPMFGAGRSADALPQIAAEATNSGSRGGNGGVGGGGMLLRAKSVGSMTQGRLAGLDAAAPPPPPLLSDSLETSTSFTAARRTLPPLRTLPQQLPPVLRTLPQQLPPLLPPLQQRSAACAAADGGHGGMGSGVRVAFGGGSVDGSSFWARKSLGGLFSNASKSDDSSNLPAMDDGCCHAAGADLRQSVGSSVPVVPGSSHDGDPACSSLLRLNSFLPSPHALSAAAAALATGNACVGGRLGGIGRGGLIALDSTNSFRRLFRRDTNAAARFAGLDTLGEYGTAAASRAGLVSPSRTFASGGLRNGSSNLDGGDAVGCHIEQSRSSLEHTRRAGGGVGVDDDDGVDLGVCFIDDQDSNADDADDEGDDGGSLDDGAGRDGCGPHSWKAVLTRSWRKVRAVAAFKVLPPPAVVATAPRGQQQQQQLRRSPTCHFFSAMQAGGEPMPPQRPPPPLLLKTTHLPPLDVPPKSLPLSMSALSSPVPISPGPITFTISAVVPHVTMSPASGRGLLGPITTSISAAELTPTYASASETVAVAVVSTATDAMAISSCSSCSSRDSGDGSGSAGTCGGGGKAPGGELPSPCPAVAPRLSVSQGLHVLQQRPLEQLQHLQQHQQQQQQQQEKQGLHRRRLGLDGNAAIDAARRAVALPSLA